MANVNPVRWPFRRTESDDATALDSDVEKKGPEAVVVEREASPSFDKHHSWHGHDIAKGADVSDWHEGSVIDTEASKIKGTAALSAFLMLFPLLYIALGVSIAILDGRKTDSIDLSWLGKVIRFSNNLYSGFPDATPTLYSLISNVITVAVTAWPVGFGIILCRTLKSYLNYRAETGTRLITLEQIAASKSFGSATTAPLSFRRVDYVTVGLFLLWSFSPVTTQALQRMFSTEFAYHTTYPILNTMDSRYVPSAYQRWHYKDGMTASTQLFAASMFQSLKDTKVQAVDGWGFPKVPSMTYAKENVKKSDDGWYDLEKEQWLSSPVFQNSETAFPFSADLGLPVFGLSGNDAGHQYWTTYEVTAGQYAVSKCQPWQPVYQEDIPRASDKFQTQLSSKSTGRTWAGYAPTCAPAVGACRKKGSLYLEMIVDMGPSTNGGSALGIVFASRIAENATHPTKNLFGLTNCMVDSYQLDVKMSCQGQFCNATSIRESKGHEGQLPLFARPWKWNFRWAVNLAEALGVATLPQYTSAMHEAGRTGLEFWLHDPESSAIGKPTASLNITDVPLDVFAKRFSYLFNSFMQAGQSPLMQTAGVRQRKRQFPTNVWDPKLLERPGTSKVGTQVYSCHWGWVALLFFSCAVVIAAIVAGSYFDVHVLGPELTGAVSSITRHNPYIPLPPGGALLGGMERTRKLADLKVRLQDVEPDNQVGKIALSTVSGSRLQRGRRYY